MAKGFGGRMPGMGGGMNMNMLKQAQKMQQDMMRMQQELQEKEYQAAAGGGGRGMRLCEMPEDVIPAFELVKSEARKAFGNDDIFIEKYLVQPKHIEVQILADQYGNVRHLGERDCTLSAAAAPIPPFAAPLPEGRGVCARVERAREHPRAAAR